MIFRFVYLKTIRRGWSINETTFSNHTNFTGNQHYPIWELLQICVEQLSGKTMNFVNNVVSQALRFILEIFFRLEVSLNQEVHWFIIGQYILLKICKLEMNMKRTLKGTSGLGELFELPELRELLEPELLELSESFELLESFNLHFLNLELFPKL